MLQLHHKKKKIQSSLEKQPSHMISADPVDYTFFKTSICRFSPSGWYQSQLVKDHRIVLFGTDIKDH